MVENAKAKVTHGHIAFSITTFEMIHFSLSSFFIPMFLLSPSTISCSPRYMQHISKRETSFTTGLVNWFEPTRLLDLSNTCLLLGSVSYVVIIPGFNCTLTVCDGTIWWMNVLETCRVEINKAWFTSVFWNISKLGVVEKSSKSPSTSRKLSLRVFGSSLRNPSEKWSSVLFWVFSPESGSYIVCFC